MAGGKTSEKQKNYWTKLYEYLKQTGNQKIHYKIQSKDHVWVSERYNNACCCLTFKTRSYLNKGPSIGCEIYIDNNKRLYNSLLGHKEEIEAEFDQSLDWQPNGFKQPDDSRIEIARTADLDNTSNYKEYFEWMIDKGEKFLKIFNEYVCKYKGFSPDNNTIKFKNMGFITDSDTKQTYWKIIEHIFFSQFFSNKKSGTIIKSDDIRKKYKEMFDILPREESFSNFFKEFNEKQENQIKKLPNGDYLIYPSEKEQIKFVSNFFKEENSGNNIGSFLSKKINDSFRKEFHYDDEKKLDKIKELFIKKTKDFIELYIEQQKKYQDLIIFSYARVNNAYEEKANLSMSKVQFKELFEKKSEEKNTPYKIIPITENTFFLVKSKITNNSQISFKETDFTQESLDKINAYLRMQGYKLGHSSQYQHEYTLIFNNDEKNLILEEEQRLRQDFLEKNIGYSLPFNEIEKEIEKKYEINNGAECLKKAIETANKKLLDIQLETSDDGQIKSKLKNENYDTDLICPFCKECFNNGENVKDHILDCHTTSDADCSILTRETESEFYCHHCNKRHLGLHKIGLNAVLKHINGDCRNTKA